jgi:acyl-coenzyme A thioesterase PaaI-like protein
MRLEGNNMCFACGKDNPIGLKMTFAAAGDDYQSEIEIKENYQGFAGIAHGGIIATALDEVMAQLLLYRSEKALTAKLEVRFRKPAPIGTKLRLRARITADHGRLIETEAEACTPEGVKIAEAKATSVRMEEASS